MKITIDYQPQPHQRLLHESQAKRLVAVTGRQVGKTVCAVNELIKRALLNPGTRNWYVTNDYKQAKRNVWDLFKKYIPGGLEAKFNTSELWIELPNYSKIELIGVENAEPLRGAAVHFMILDEYADFPRDVWPKVLRPMFSTTNGDAWFLSTPKGMGNDLYEKFYNSGYQTFRFPSCEVVNGVVQNPLSEYAAISELQAAYDDDTTPNKEVFNQEYLAEFTRPSGTVYSGWPLKNFRKVDYDPFLPVHLSFDFGINDPTAIIWIQPSGGEFRVIDYYEARNANVAHFVSVIKSKPYKEYALATGDDAGRSRALTTGTSAIDEYAAHGIFIRTTPGLKIEDQVRETQKHIKSLFVDKSLKRFRDCLLNYRYPQKKEGALNQSNEKPIHDEFSHAMRALEYYFVNYKGTGGPIKPYNKKKWSL